VNPRLDPPYPMELLSDRGIDPGKIFDLQIPLTDVVED